jgi:anthranilate phosphoribosyltransferase
VRREDLTAAAAAAALEDVLGGNASPAQTAAFMVGLRMKGETVEEMAGLVRAMVDHAVAVDAPAGAVDTCGTGGDGSGSINISTIAAFIVAGAGVVVCKHGNRAASSVSGSADVLEALGVAVDLGAAGVERCLRDAGIGFCLAPRFHPAMRHVIPIRRELGVPTVFNYLGPLANPGRVRHQVVGVSDPAMARKMVGVLEAGGARRALVVYGHDGLDELTTTTTSTVVDFSLDDASGPATRTYDVNPRALGLNPAAVDDFRGAEPATNARLARKVLEGHDGAHRDIVLLNAAAGLVAAGRVDDLEAGLHEASASLDSGRAGEALERLVAVSQAAAVEHGS